MSKLNTNSVLFAENTTWKSYLSYDFLAIVWWRFITLNSKHLHAFKKKKHLHAFLSKKKHLRAFLFVNTVTRFSSWLGDSIPHYLNTSDKITLLLLVFFLRSKVHIIKDNGLKTQVQPVTGPHTETQDLRELLASPSASSFSDRIIDTTFLLLVSISDIR